MVKEFARQLRPMLPGWLVAGIRKVRHRRNEALRFEVGKFSAKFAQITAGVVASGPFRGMHYVERAWGSALCPKLAGTYELEIHSAIDEIKNHAGKYDRILDVGAAEGYYAIGLALIAPKANVIAFEMMENGRRLITDMATRNGVADRIEIRGTATVDELNQAMANCKSPLVVMDVEGAEETLLDPATIPNLQKAAILVETHEALSAGITNRLIQRFKLTHEIKEFTNRTRSTGDCPPEIRKKLENDRQAFLSVWENRGMIQGWLWMKPRG